MNLPSSWNDICRKNPNLKGENKKGEETATEENKEEKASKKTWKQNRQEKVKFTYKEQREYETIDEDIAKLEEKLASIERQITANATNSVKLRELMEKQENCATELEEKEERWMYLNELAEQMGLWDNRKNKKQNPL